ncbi:MAG: TIM barrel protein [Kiritimatiellia bacterium]
MQRRDFLKMAAGVATVAGLPLGARAQGENPATPFKTKLKKALIRPRLTEAVAKELQEAGFPGVELQDKSVTVAEARAARRLAEDRGLQIHSFMGGWAEFNSKDPAKRKAAIETTKANLQIAQAYGAPVMLLVPGRVGGVPLPKPSQFKLEFDPTTLLLARAAEADFPAYVQAQNDATKYAQDAIGELVPHAADLGVVLGLENVWNNLWVMPDFAAAFIRSFRNPWVKAYLDLGNHARYAMPEKWLTALDDQIVKLHIKDFKIDRAKDQEGAFVRIGDGSIDWRRVRRTIEAVNYNGWVSIESGGWTNDEHSEIMDRFFLGSL